MLGDSAVIFLLSHAKLLPKEKYAAWQGFYIATYQTADHELRKVIFSNYGGFLYDSHSNRYYELLEKHREKWHKLITKDLDELFNPKIE
ncbi:hypothetical protein [Niastella yeongjuensis]|nr:hypothetical protein [Niastella yeongjuensis]